MYTVKLQGVKGLRGVVSLDLCSIVSKVMLNEVRLGCGGLGAVTLGKGCLVKGGYVRLERNITHLNQTPSNKRDNNVVMYSSTL